MKAIMFGGVITVGSYHRSRQWGDDAQCSSTWPHNHRRHSSTQLEQRMRTYKTKRLEPNLCSACLKDLEGSALDVWSACLLVVFSLRKPDDRFLMAFSSFQWWVACQTHIFDHVLSTSCNSLRSPLTGYVHFMHYTNMAYHFYKNGVSALLFGSPIGILSLKPAFAGWNRHAWSAPSFGTGWCNPATKRSPSPLGPAGQSSKGAWKDTENGGVK